MIVKALGVIALLAPGTMAAPIPSGPLDSYPAPSPDGGTMLFVSGRGDREAIWIAEGHDKAPRLLLDGTPLGKNPGGPVWAPDGRRFAFAMRPAGDAGDDETDIYVANADGSGLRRLTHTRGDDSHPHWTADGKRIVFNSVRATPDLSVEWSAQWNDIYSMAADGSDVRRITDCQSVCTYGTPSPDGRWVAYRRVTNAPGKDWSLTDQARNSEVFVRSPDGQVDRNLSQSPAFDGWPTWTPNSRWVVFVSNRAGPANTGQIYAIRPDGTGLRQLTSGRFSRVQPWVSADSRQLYFAERIEDEHGEFGRISAIELALP